MQNPHATYLEWYTSQACSKARSKFLKINKCLGIRARKCNMMEALITLFSTGTSLLSSFGCHLLFSMRIIDGDSIRSRLDSGWEPSTAVANGRRETGRRGYICLDLQATWRRSMTSAVDRNKTDQTMHCIIFPPHHLLYTV